MKLLQLVSQLAKKLVYVKVSVMYIYDGVKLVPMWKGHWNKSKKFCLLEKMSGGWSKGGGLESARGKTFDTELFFHPCFAFPTSDVCFKTSCSVLIYLFF